MKEKVKKKKRTVRAVRKIAAKVPRCECGGEMHAVILKEFDFTPWSGLSSTLGQVPGLRCSKCSHETISGAVINTTMHSMSAWMLRMPHRLPAECARYLRRVLEVTQQELGERMGIARETVAQWECGEKEISPQHDFILRTLFLSNEANEKREEMRRKLDLLEAMVSVHAQPPPRNLVFPIRFENIDYEKPAAAARPRRAGRSTGKSHDVYA